jgi:hypothetical protein
MAKTDLEGQPKNMYPPINAWLQTVKSRQHPPPHCHTMVFPPTPNGIINPTG